MIKGPDGNLMSVSWEDAIVTVAKMLDSAPADNIAAVAGGQCDAEVFICTQLVFSNFCFSPYWH